MDSPLVSVIIPCYNAEKYVEIAVTSIMNQTYKNLEIIITNDNSTDNTLTVLQNLAKIDPRIIVVNNTKNKKIVKSLNYMIELAKGKYIARMDADDFSLPERIAKQVDFMEKYPEIGVCGTNAYIINENGRIISESRCPITSEDNKDFLIFFSTLYHPTVMIKSEILKAHQYNEKYLYAEDYELWCRLVYKHGIKISNLKEKLFSYRVFKQQTSYSHFMEQNKACASIFKDNIIIKPELLIEHNNVFFLNESKQSFDKEYKMIKYYEKQLKKKNLRYSSVVCRKYLIYMIKSYGILKNISLIFNKLGLYTVFLYFIEKMKQKKGKV